VEAKKLGIKNATKLKKTQLINEIDDKVLKLAEEKRLPSRVSQINSHLNQVVKRHMTQNHF